MGTLKVQMLARLVAAVVLLNLVAGAALARDFTAAEKDALAARVDAFGLAMSAKDYDTVLGVTPPRIHAALDQMLLQQMFWRDPQATHEGLVEILIGVIQWQPQFTQSQH